MSGEVRAGDLARANPPTCSLRERMADLRERDDLSEWGLCAVIDRARVIHGLVEAARVAHVDPETLAEDVMKLAPATIRPSASVESALSRLNEIDGDSILVSSGRGVLLGVLMRSDVADHLDEST